MNKELEIGATICGLKRIGTLCLIVPCMLQVVKESFLNRPKWRKVLLGELLLQYFLKVYNG